MSDDTREGGSKATGGVQATHGQRTAHEAHTRRETYRLAICAVDINRDVDVTLQICIANACMAVADAEAEVRFNRIFEATMAENERLKANVEMAGQFVEANDAMGTALTNVRADLNVAHAEQADLKASIAFKDDAMLTAMRNLVANDAEIEALIAQRDEASDIAKDERDKGDEARATIARVKALADLWEYCGIRSESVARIRGELDEEVKG